MLALLLKKQEQEQEQAGVAPVLQLIPGGGEKNAMAAKFDEFAAMARRGELYDYAVVVVLADTSQSKMAWGSVIPSIAIAGAVGHLFVRLNLQLASTSK